VPVDPGWVIVGDQHHTDVISWLAGIIPPPSHGQGLHVVPHLDAFHLYNRGAVQDADSSVVETRLPLPAVEFRPSVLSVAAAYPPRTTAGAPFTLQLRLRNDSALSQAVHVTVGSADGFLFSGQRRLSLGGP